MNARRFKSLECYVLQKKVFPKFFLRSAVAEVIFESCHFINVYYVWVEERVCVEKLRGNVIANAVHVRVVIIIGGVGSTDPPHSKKNSISFDLVRSFVFCTT